MKGIDLLDIKQNDGESNKRFITRFKRAMTTIKDANDSVLIKSFKEAISLRSILLLNTLSKIALGVRTF